MIHVHVVLEKSIRSVVGDKKFIFVLIRNRIEIKGDIIIQNVLIDIGKRGITKRHSWINYGKATE